MGGDVGCGSVAHDVVGAEDGQLGWADALQLRFDVQHYLRGGSGRVAGAPQRLFLLIILPREFDEALGVDVLQLAVDSVQVGLPFSGLKC